MFFANIGARGFGILIFIAIMVGVIAIRPSFLINPETQDWKTFGFGSGKSCCNITVVAVIVALLSYLTAYMTASGISKMRGGGDRISAFSASAVPEPSRLPEPPIIVPANASLNDVADWWPDT